jgi:hypothetical protein
MRPRSVGDVMHHAAAGVPCATWGKPCRRSGSSRSPCRRHALTLTGGSRAVTLQLATTETYTGATFYLAADGSGGTDLSVMVPPVISGAVAGQTVADTSTILPFSAVTITDNNSGTPTNTLTVVSSSSANGIFSDSVGGTISGATYTATNSASAVQTRIEALTFTPTVLAGVPGTSLTTTFTSGRQPDAGRYRQPRAIRHGQPE